MHHSIYTVLLLLTLSCSSVGQTDGNKNMKINGVSLEGPSRPMSDTLMTEMVSTVHSNWISLSPYAYIKKDDSTVKFNNGNWQWWGEQEVGVKKCAQEAQKAGMKVMIKPHLWCGWGEFTGDMDYETEEDWKNWQKTYKAYILAFASLSEELDVDLLCIGTELKNPVAHDPQYWLELIMSVKEVYSGKLTYAGNWDSYKDFPHWEYLDFIGVDAYFPLIEESTPAVDSCIAAWSGWIQELASVSQKHDKPILFTEYGYRSIDGCAARPWETGQSDHFNEQAQANAYEGLFKSVWKKEWMAGGFLWKWIDQQHFGPRTKFRYTPQGKMATQVIANHYGNLNE